MWNKPWNYKKGLVIGVGLLAIGTLLQTAVGAINWSLFACPIDVIILVVYIIALIAMHLLCKHVYLFGWLSHYSAAVSSLIRVVGMTVIMGLIRQAPSGRVSNDILGFSQMISSWTFVLLYFWMVTVLGLTILHTSFPFRIGRLSFLPSHAGLFAALITATLGNADIQYLKMTTRIGNAEQKATDGRGKLIEFPLTIELKDFTIDEYPPRLMLIDSGTGEALPEKSPVHLLLEGGVPEGNLLGQDLFVEQSVPMVAFVATEDTLKFTDSHSMGATCAAYLKAINQKNQRAEGGWVGCGSFLFSYRALHLDSLTSLVMPGRGPQRFASEVEVCTQKGTITENTIEVNRPMEIAGWKIYQLSYNESKGRWSDINVFELVRDPWLPVVCTGITVMMLGAIYLSVSA